MKIGVITDCMKTPLDKALKKIGELNFDGVQIYATTGSFSPSVLTIEDREYYKKLLKENNLEVSALCGDMGGHGFEIEKDNLKRIEKSKKIVDLAVEFNSKVINNDLKNEIYKTMQLMKNISSKYLVINQINGLINFVNAILLRRRSSYFIA